MEIIPSPTLTLGFLQQKAHDTGVVYKEICVDYTKNFLRGD